MCKQFSGLLGLVISNHMLPFNFSFLSLFLTSFLVGGLHSTGIGEGNRVLGEGHREGQIWVQILAYDLLAVLPCENHCNHSGSLFHASNEYFLYRSGLFMIFNEVIQTKA